MNRIVGSGVKALIVRGDQVLILTKAKSLIGEPRDIPGGKVEFGEEPEQALAREVREETGLDIEIVRPLHMCTIMKTPEMHVVATIFLCHARGEVKLSNEHTEFRWILRRDIVGYPPFIQGAVERL